MKRNILFLTEKWPNGNPLLNLTNNFHNLFNSFSQNCREENLHLLHLDESSVIYGKHIDEIAPNYCSSYKIHTVIVSLLGSSSYNPTAECFAKIKAMGVRLIFMWPDSNPGDLVIRERIGDLADKNIIWDNPFSPLHNTLPRDERNVYLWVPQDGAMFYSDTKNQIIPVSFVGSPRYQDRMYYLNYLLTNSEVNIRGGQYEEGLNPEQYAELIRTSKININFAASPNNFYQCKGRVFEALACQTMLLESRNPSTASLFEPGEDYVEFSSPEDLVDKIHYYSYNDGEREAIALNGHRKYNQLYTSKLFWERVL